MDKKILIGIAVCIFIVFLSCVSLSIAGAIKRCEWFGQCDAPGKKDTTTPVTTAPTTPVTTAPTTPATTSTTPPSTTALTAPSSVTVNGKNINTGGKYTVGRGWYWQPAAVISTTNKPSDKACQDECISGTDCVFWQRNPITSNCDTYKFTEYKTETAHIRGRTLTPGNFGDAVEQPGQTYTNPQQCLDKCDSISGCIGWHHRSNDHPEDKWKNTCTTFNNRPNETQFVEGPVLK